MTDWKKNMGMPENTGLIKIYAPMSHKETWQEEANEKNYSSTSKYLHELIQEARAIRQEGFLSPQSGNQEEISKLQNQIETLEERLEAERENNQNAINTDVEFLAQFLTDQYQSFDEILQRVVESGSLDELIRKPIEDELYFLAARDEVEYQHGHGWKLKNGGGR